MPARPLARPEEADPAPAGTPAGTLADRAIDLALRGIIGATMRLPYDARVPAMGALVRRAVGPLAGYRRRALANLALVRPDWPEARRREVAGEVLDNFGRTLIENYSHRELGARLAGAPVSGGGLPHVERAAAEGRPVLFVTGHFGNHEAPRHALAARASPWAASTARWATRTSTPTTPAP